MMDCSHTNEIMKLIENNAKELIDKTEENHTEYAFSICQKNDRKYIDKVCKGDSSCVVLKPCKDSQRVGMFHTHPTHRRLEITRDGRIRQKIESDINFSLLDLISEVTHNMKHSPITSCVGGMSSNGRKIMRCRTLHGDFVKYFVEMLKYVRLDEVHKPMPKAKYADKEDREGLAYLTDYLAVRTVEILDEDADIYAYEPEHYQGFVRDKIRYFARCMKTKHLD
jgi:hypothetical protein